MQKKPQGLGRGLGALLNPDLLKAPPTRVKSDLTITDHNLASEADSENRSVAAKPQKIIGATTPLPTTTQAHVPKQTLNTLKTQDLVSHSAASQQSVLELSVQNLKPLTDQPRTEFFSTTLDELATSIKSYGILQPLVVAPAEQEGRFTIIAGERRWRAAQIAGLEKVPCVLRKPSEHSSLELALIENIQREELSPLDEARAFSRLLDEHSYTQDTLAAKVGKDRATIANSLRLLGLPAELLTDLQAKVLTAGHARALCSLDEKKLQLKVRDMIVSKKLSVRQTEDIVKELKKDRDSADTTAQPQLSPDLRHLCDQFKGHLGTKVRITGTADRGKIEISYYTFEDLERIAELMLAPGLNARRPMG
ncbi:ParB/RepB/Spo0J family partition protein [bacterium]|nr:ParB/RepB/Spo0J family partition protein [bacterium]